MQICRKEEYVIELPLTPPETLVAELSFFFEEL